LQDVEHGFVAVVAGKQLDRSLDHDMQEVGQVAFADQCDALRESLQQRRVHQFVEMLFADVFEQRQCANEVDFSLTHRALRQA
jgi:hypothetical protein